VYVVSEFETILHPYASARVRKSCLVMCHGVGSRSNEREIKRMSNKII
jgi:hypothetical protein